MFVSACKWATYGIRVRNQDVLRYFKGCWNSIEIEIDGEFYSFRLSSTFWTTCPEFRGRPIPDWLKEQGLIPWPKGNPPKFELAPLKDNIFRLKRMKNKKKGL